ncbi:hypothetical protein LJC34_00505 [Oscillospiraceae bacterium OttesenSCG-928-G22]|nr:hypothetical protein [Oscillospiraceae bacterium OttesenSCG-928-G22]
MPDFFIRPEEISAWEEKQREKNLRRMYKTEKRFVCPRTEKRRDFRHAPVRLLSLWHEDRWVVTMTKRKFRRFLKREVENEIYYRTVNRDYRTGGWLTW